MIKNVFWLKFENLGFADRLRITDTDGMILDNINLPNNYEDLFPKKLLRLKNWFRVKIKAHRKEPRGKYFFFFPHYVPPDNKKVYGFYSKDGTRISEFCRCIFNAVTTTDFQDPEGCYVTIERSINKHIKWETL